MRLIVQFIFACQVIEFCERHRTDRPPLMKPYVPPPPKPYWMMTAAEREADRLKASGQQVVVAPTAPPTVKLEQQAESENAVASGSGSGNSGDTNGVQQAGTTGATENRLLGEAVPATDPITTGSINTSDTNKAVNGLEEAASQEASSKEGKENDQAGTEPIGVEEEETPAMVPMTLLEVEQADDKWDKEFLQVSLQPSLIPNAIAVVDDELTGAVFRS